MDTNRSPREVEKLARDLLERGSIEVPGGSSAIVGPAAAVCDEAGAPHSWVVPLTIHKKLVAWAQFSPQLALQRFSVFLRSEGDLDHCPDAADWFDPEVVRRRVIAQVGAALDLTAPVLTFDRDPSRLVWLVEVVGRSGAKRRWFVAGQSVWEDPGFGEVTGGPGR